MSSWDIYWILKLDDIGMTLAIMAIIAGSAAIVFGIFGLCAVVEKDLSIKQYKTIIVSLGLVFILTVIPATFLPTTKQMATILVIPKIANNEKIQQIPDKVLNLADQWIDELSPKKDESK